MFKMLKKNLLQMVEKKQEKERKERKERRQDLLEISMTEDSCSFPQNLANLRKPGKASSICELP